MIPLLLHLQFLSRRLKGRGFKQFFYFYFLNPRLTRVLVIGAGVSGLSAASYISKQDKNVDVIVLEGRNRIGGRIHTVILGGDQKIPVDCGASFIHGVEDNNVFDLAKELNVNLKAEFGGYTRGWLGKALWYSDTGIPIKENDVRAASELFDDIVWRVGEKAKKLKPGIDDECVADAVDSCLPRKKKAFKRLSKISKRILEKMQGTAW